VHLRVLNAVIYHVTISAFLNASRYQFTFLTQVSTYRVPYLRGLETGQTAVPKAKYVHFPFPRRPNPLIL